MGIPPFTEFAVCDVGSNDQAVMGTAFLNPYRKPQIIGVLDGRFSLAGDFVFKLPGAFVKVGIFCRGLKPGIGIQGEPVPVRLGNDVIQREAGIPRYPGKA